MYNYTALVTLLALMFYCFTSAQVSKARRKYGVKLPAISGNPDFERVFRVQMNTLEWLPIYLASLWMFAIYISDVAAASIGVARARARYGIKAPTISGNPDFERVFRVQMNTLEWLPIFLPSLWLFAIYISDWIAAAIGLVWIIGRVVYLVGYSQAAAKRGPGFGIQAMAATVLAAGALVAIVWRIVHG